MRSDEVRRAESKVVLRGAEIANQRMRTSFIDTFIAPKLLLWDRLKKATIFVLRLNWKPLRPDWLRGLEYEIDVHDGMFPVVMKHHDEIEKIALASTTEAIMENPKPFIEAMLRDALKNPDPHYRIDYSQPTSSEE